MQILKVKTPERKIGDTGERAAARYLKRAGYKILQKNYVDDSGRHEIDIVCSNKEYLVFAEVKTRVGDGGDFLPRPASAVNAEKIEGLILAAKNFRYYNFALSKERLMRFDIIEVLLDEKHRVKKIEHLEAAFTADKKYRLNKWR